MSAEKTSRSGKSSLNIIQYGVQQKMSSCGKCHRLDMPEMHRKVGIQGKCIILGAHAFWCIKMLTQHVVPKKWRVGICAKAQTLIGLPFCSMKCSSELASATVFVLQPQRLGLALLFNEILLSTLIGGLRRCNHRCDRKLGPRELRQLSF